MILVNLIEPLLVNSLAITRIRRMFLSSSKSNTVIQPNMTKCIQTGRSNIILDKHQLDRQSETHSSRSKRRIYSNLDTSSLTYILTFLSSRNFSITGWTLILKRQSTNSRASNLTRITRSMLITTWVSALTWSTKKCTKWIQTRRSHNLQAIKMSRKKWLRRF